MKRRDARKLGRAGQAELRRQAVRLLERGFSCAEVGEMLDVHPDTVSRWKVAFAEQGEALFEVRRGRGHRSSTMSEEQLRWLVDAVKHRSPRDFGLDSPLWSLAQMRAVVGKEFSLLVPISTLHATVQRAGLRARKPRKQASERDDAEVERWMKEVWPTVAADAERGRKVFFLDEAQARADSLLGRTWSERGTRPVVKHSAKRPRVNMVGCVSWDGELVFGTYRGSLDGPLFASFLRYLLATVTGCLTVVLDNLSVHFAPAVKELLAEVGDRLRLVRLPPYAPDMNPAEHGWSHLKGTLRRHPLKKGEDIVEVVEWELDQIRRAPELVRSFFQHPQVTYLRDSLPGAV